MNQVEPRPDPPRRSTPASMFLAGLTCAVLAVGASYIVLFTRLWLLLKIPIAFLALLWCLMTWFAGRRLLRMKANRQDDPGQAA